MSTSELVEDRREVGLLQTPELLWEKTDLRLVRADSEDRKDLLRPVVRVRALENRHRSSWMPAGKNLSPKEPP